MASWNWQKSSCSEVQRNFSVLSRAHTEETDFKQFDFLQRETKVYEPNALIKLVNTQNVSVTRIVDSSSIQRAETK